MRKPLDLQGKTFTWLKVVKRVEDYINKNGTHNSMWLCQCRCGNEVIVRGVQLTSGKTKSCGCLRIEKLDKAKKNLINMMFLVNMELVGLLIQMQNFISI